MEIVKEPPKEGLKKFNAILDTLTSKEVGTPKPLFEGFKDFGDYITSRYPDTPARDLWTNIIAGKEEDAIEKYGEHIAPAIKKMWDDLDDKFKKIENTYSEMEPLWKQNKFDLTELIDKNKIPKLEKNNLKYHVREWLKEPTDFTLQTAIEKSKNLRDFFNKNIDKVKTSEELAVKTANRMKKVGPLGKLGLVLGIGIPAMELFNPDKAEAAYNTTSMLADPFGILHSEGLNQGEDEEMIKFHDYQRREKLKSGGSVLDSGANLKSNVD